MVNTNTGSVDLPAMDKSEFGETEQHGLGVDGDLEIGFDDPLADEKTPFQPLEDPESLFRDLDRLGTTGKGEAGPSKDAAAEWRLKTESGLTFRFTDPVALLDWKKKLTAYSNLSISPDGTSWADFADFVGLFEQSRDANNAFLVCMNGGESDPELDAMIAKPDYSETPSRGRPGSSPTTEFTFKMAEPRGKAVVRNVVLALLGAGLGVGAVLFAMWFFDKSY